MSYTAKKLIDIAIKEIGYKEKETNSQLASKEANAGDGNWTKYAKDLHAAGYYQASKNGYAWCDVFVDWCFLQLSGSKEKGEWLECQTGVYGAGCTWSSNCYRNAGRFGTEPKVGAQIFFAKNGKGSEEHTGIVEKFDKSYVYTIEGNASNMVKRKTYNRTSTYICGYGYPRFDEDPSSETKTEIASNYFGKDDVVTIVAGSNWINGKTVPSWVVKKQWIVKSASTTDERVVVDRSTDGSNAINSSIHFSCLELVKRGGAQADKQEAELDGTTPITPSQKECEHLTTKVVNKKDATCAVVGYTGDMQCSDCGKIIKQGETVPTIPHNYELKNVVAPTYNQDGYTGNKVCRVCGHTEFGTTTEKLELPFLEETPEDDSVDISISRNWIVRFIKWLLGLLKK